MIPGLPDIDELDKAQVEKLASLDDHLLNDTKPNEIQTDLHLLDYLDQVRKNLKEVLSIENHKLSVHLQFPYQFGRFQLLEQLGEGGQGIVFRAYDPNREVDVAIKLLNTAGRQWDTQRQARFRREARVTSRINTPHVASVLEASQVDGTSYIVMPYCPGPSLAQWLTSRQGRPVPIHDAVNLILALTKAVVSCHSHGVLHRDLKPGNVLLFPLHDEVPRDAELSCFEPRICDFGLSRAEDEDDGESITGSHTVLGSRAYMSPEQAEGNQVEVSTSADLWALGVILYELVTGHKPYGDDGRTLLKILTADPVNPSQFRSDIPKDLEAIILKCLSKSINQRYSTVSAFGEELSLFLQGKPTQARPLRLSHRLVRWAKRRPWIAAAATCFILTLCIFSSAIIRYEYQLRGSFALVSAKKIEAENSANQLEESVYAITLREVTDLIKRGKADVGLDKLLTFIPQDENALDRRELSWKLLHHQLWSRPVTVLPKKTSIVHSIGKTADRRFLLTEGDNLLFLWDLNSGNSNQLLSNRENALWGSYGRRATSTFFAINHQTNVISIRFSNQSVQPSHQISIKNRLDTTGLVGCDVSSNRKWFAGSSPKSGLFLHNFENGRQQVLPWPWLPKVNGAVSWCSFSADSRKVVVSSNSFQPQLSVCSLEDGKFFGHLDLGEISNLLAMSVQDDSCWCGFENGRMIRFDLNDLKIVKEWKLTNPETYRLKNAKAFAPPAYSSPENGIWVLGRTNGEVVEIDLINGKEKVLTRHQGPVCLIISDGTQQILSLDGHEARLINRENGNLIKSWPVPSELAVDEGLAFLTHGVYYPNERELILGGQNGRLVIWRLDGTVSEKAIRHGSREAWVVRFSPDGQTLVTAGEGNIHFWNRFTGDRIKTLKGQFGFIEAVTFSSDGRTLVTGGSARSIAILNSSNGELMKQYKGLSESVRSVALSPDGQVLAAGLRKQKHDYGYSAKIVMWNLSTGIKLAEWEAHEDHVRALVFSPDSKLLYSGSEDNLIKAWKTSTQELVNTIRDIQEVWHLRLQEDRIISAGSGNSVSTWNLSNGALLQRFRDPDSAIRALAISPDGKTIVTGGETGPIRFWLAFNGQELTSIDVGKEKVLSLDISSDGRFVAAGCTSGKVIMLEAGQATESSKAINVLVK